jgi:hypothetical protein
VEKRTDILYRLARFLAGVPPEALGAMFLVVFEYPDVLLAVVVWMLSSILGHIFVLVTLAFLTAYTWRKLPLCLRHAIRRIAAAFLPSEVVRVLGIMPGRKANAEVGMDRLAGHRVPKAWLNERVEIEFHKLNSTCTGQTPTT